MFESVLELTRSFLDMGVPGYDLSVWKDGKCVLRHMGGYADFENKIPVQGNERYNIYSCSKLITCSAAMQLWEKGLFSLEDPLADYMPEFSEMTVQTENGICKAKNPILIRNLFEMTAGFSYDLNTPQLELCRRETNGRCPTRETMRYLAKEPLIFEPGEQWRYSLCHDVLAALVEVISGQRFEVYVKEHIFDPLGMTDSTFLLPYSQLDSVACQYAFKDGKAVEREKTVRYRLGSEYASGGAGCVSTVDDYMKFLEAMRVGDSILKKQTIALMATDRLTPQQKQTFSLAKTKGYGLGMRTPREGLPYTEFGWGGAAGAYASVDIPNGLSIFYAQHLLQSPNQGIRSEIYKNVYHQLQGSSAETENIPTPGQYKETY